MKLLVIILNYRTTQLTIDCLRSLLPELQSVPESRVIVCDNASGSHAEEQLRDAIATNEWGGRVELIVNSENLGFTGGNNAVLRKWVTSEARPQYFLLLNSDTIVHHGAISALASFMDLNPHVGIAGSNLELPDGTRQGTPFRFPSIATELDRGLRLGVVSRLLSRWSIAPPTPSMPTQVDWVSGAAMIIRREVIETIGALDDGLFMYFEDVDYCLNAKRAGWATWHVPQSRITHFGGGSSGIALKRAKRLPTYWFQARRRFFLKNYGRLYTALADAAFLCGFATWRLRRLLQQRPDPDPPSLLMDSLRNSVFLTGFKLRRVAGPASDT